MADITVGGKGFEGVIATFNTSCVTNIKITPTVDWIDFTIETNTVNARVEAYTGDNPRQQSFTLSFTALTENNDGSESEKACTKDFSIEQLSKNFHPEEGGEDPPTPPTPEVCTKFIVDGGHLNAEKEGKVGCDSAYLYGNPTAVYSPSTASSWVHISYVYYYEDPSHCCTDYASFPEVAYDMQDEAGVPRDLNDHNLGTVWYTVDPNGDDEDRSCEVWFIVDNVECTSKKYVITQSGGETPPSEPCEVEYTVNGLEGTDKAIVHWAYGNEEQVGNGTISHTYSTGGKHTASVSAPGYTTDYAYFDCDAGVVTWTSTIEKSAGGCSCDDFVLNEEERIQTIDYRVQTITVSYTLPDDCVLRVYHQPTWVSECTINPSTKKISITVDEVSEPKQGTVEFEVEGRHCTAQNKAIGIERKENECKFPGDTIQIMLTGLNSSYEYYVLTDQVIGVNCTEWIKSNGHKYYPANSGIRSLGYYQYQACTLTQYDSGENYYCSITTPGSATCNGSNTSLSSNTTYHLYGFTGTNFSEIKSVTMPDGDTAQSGANSEKQYIV